MVSDEDASFFKGNLERRGIDTNPSCDYCGSESEDSQHLFRFCNLAKLVWMYSPLQICSNDVETVSLKKWIQSYILLFNSKDGGSEAKLDAFISILWSLWVTRNERVFRNESKHVRAVLLTMDRMLGMAKHFKECTLATGKSMMNICKPLGFDLVQLGAVRNQVADFILQIDGSWEKKTRKSGGGWAFKEHSNARYREGGGCYGSALSATQVETEVCLKAMEWAEKQGKREILVITDSSVLVSTLDNIEIADISMFWMVSRIRRLATTFNICSFLKVDRGQVQEAHEIANKCRKNGVTFNSVI
ncbi:uncharacterized protein [Spinacia oleracea]|uniref:RNase H type-1 domain-containing protein n=1 Tax=Spinacia oleracea TaxID=3562 RepID=A0ABM3RJL4_SPIOL|nr:uncharacterized protein LOC130470174 [Spinacia oleracea]